MQICVNIPSSAFHGIHGCSDYKTTFKTQFSPFNMQVLRMKLTLSGLGASPLATDPSHLPYILDFIHCLSDAFWF